MLKTLHKIARIGIVTEPAPAAGRGDARARSARRAHPRQCWVGRCASAQVDAGSCNGCELEIHALGNPFYSIESLGIRFVASPRHADMLLVTGPVSRHMEVALRRTYDATPDPKLVVAVGDCGACGGVFGTGYATLGAVANVIPVDVVVAGCPPTPTQVLAGILTALSGPKPGR